jgi:hypothetical protein
MRLKFGIVEMPFRCKLRARETQRVLGKVIWNTQLDATITVLLISKISSTSFGQTFAHLQERRTEIFTAYGIMSCKNGNTKIYVVHM